MRVEAYLSTTTAPDDCGQGSSGKVSRNILQDLLPLSTAHRTTLHITSLGLGEPGFQRVRERRGDFHLYLEMPYSDVGGTNVGEGKVLLVVVQDVPL